MTDPQYQSPPANNPNAGINRAFHKQALQDICNTVFYEWEDMDRIAQAWKQRGCMSPFVEYAIETLCKEKHDYYEENYHSLAWAKDNLPRYYLNAWCQDHGYDFLTLCRVIDDADM